MICGIDLGTTNSLIGVYTEKGVKLIPNRLGKLLTPSIVSLDEEGKISVGETAHEYGLTHPERVASVFKRFMGSTKKYRLGDKEFTPEELSAFVLRSLKEDAEKFFGEEITEAVISVPAYFDEKRRRATKRAGELAGIKVERIISEPTAAAVAYGLYEKDKNSKFLVFDLGGGTFDVSILELFGTTLEVRAVAGDNYLGGEDFTAVLENIFMEKNKMDIDNFSEKEIIALREICERAKIELGEKSKVTIEFQKDGQTYACDISVGEYKILCESLFEKIRRQVQRSLRDAHLKISDINEILFVGGTTKMPIVREFATKLFKKFPNTNINPDEVVATGAAIQAAMKERREEVKEVILTDVCPFTLGTEVAVRRPNGTTESGHYCPIIERNTVIPASRTETMYTLHDNQTEMWINVLQGESRFAANNLQIGELRIHIPKNKAGEESVDVTYTYDINSLLEVQVKINSTGEIIKKIFKENDNGMTTDEIEKRMEELSYLKVHPRDQEENRLLLMRGERLYEVSIGDQRMIIEMWIREFEEALNTRDNGKINDARREFAKHLKEIDDYM